MPEVLLGAPPTSTASTGPPEHAELYVAKAVPTQERVDHDRLSLQRVQVRRRDDGDECIAQGPGLLRSGRPMNIKPNLHWVIKSLPNGLMEIRPVKGWYDLASSSNDSATRRPTRLQNSMAAQELQQQARDRKETSDRWDAMNKRRQQRGEVKLQKTIDGSEDKAAPVLFAEDASKADALAVEQQAEKRRKESSDRLDAMDQRLTAQRAQAGASVLFPDDTDQADESGFERQAEKRRKVLQKLQKEQEDGAEEKAVPDVASTLLELKRQHGEAAWDFCDEEQFSDDEEKDEENIEDAAAQEEEALPSGDEEDEETKPEATLSGVGEELQVLLKCDPDAESPQHLEEELPEAKGQWLDVAGRWRNKRMAERLFEQRAQRLFLDPYCNDVLRLPLEVKNIISRVADANAPVKIIPTASSGDAAHVAMPQDHGVG
ncbi:unnamed protein product [Durusdinium trenchii]|uniref:Uncharacterized protein n=1 Tax=Durusdinium trenchii TaxID=1381693 RepID=A0ABP0NL10_9DINO